MKIIGAGIGRTGTMSMKIALEVLGFGPCYHMHELFAHPEHAPLWLDAAARRSVPWDEVFSGYQSTMDEPGSVFYEDLMEAYPDAVVILNVRDPESWYESRKNTVYQLTAAEAGSPFAMSQEPLARVPNAVIWEGLFQGVFLDKERAIDIFERHNQEVKERVPPERLLVHDVKDGWQPLCDFLGVDVPADMPFPRLNTTQDWQAMFGAFGGNQ